ncbi:relaxin-3 [Desmodus rotundus]|uniref:relaxin-3 n=1 Tax=Desmodus rotundus TaxID=9430 RepID=UPI0039E6D838
MAKHPMLLLMAVWMLAAGLWLEAEAQGPSDKEKLCGREFVRTAIYVCGNPRLRWSRSATPAQEAMGDAFPDADTEPEEAVASTERLALTKSPETFFGDPASWQGPPGVLRHSRDLLSDCCNKGCSKKEISMFC